MAANEDDRPDGSSIKPVSSLLSHFEKIHHVRDVPPPSPQSPRLIATNPQPEAASAKPVKKIPPPPPPTRRSIDVSRQGSPQPSILQKSKPQPAIIADQSSPAEPPRLTSTPTVLGETLVPLVDISAPKPAASDSESPATVRVHKAPLPKNPTPTAQKPRDHLQVRDPAQFRIPSRSRSPFEDSAKVNEREAPQEQRPQPTKPPRDASTRPAPPVNRAAKPSISHIDGPPASSLRPAVGKETSTSPFNTPPSSPESCTDTSRPPPLPLSSKPCLTSSSQPDVSSPVARHERQDSRDAGENQRVPLRQGLTISHHGRERSRSDLEDAEDAPAARPGLPPRKGLMATTDLSTTSQSTSMNKQKSSEMPHRPSALSQGFSSVANTPPRKGSLGTQTALPASARNHSEPRARNNLIAPSSAKVSDITPTKYSRTGETSKGQPIAIDVAAGSSIVDFPDSSSANRRPPCHPEGPRLIPTGYDTRLLDVCGEYVCTTGSHTRVWNILTGKLLLNIAHGESVKITALAFKPARKIDEEGRKLWLGTNWGEIQELDVDTKRVTAVNGNAHGVREVIKIHRHAAELWSLDAEGKLIVWPTDRDGSPSLNNGIFNGRILRGHTASIVVDDKLWLGVGKELVIYQPSVNADENTFKVTDRPFSVQGAGDVISCAVLPDGTDRVYFGHSDGKVTVFSTATLSHVETINVGISRINCLVGVGDYLWAGFNNGIISIYDTKTRPWTMKKYWHTHTHPVVSIIADSDSLWKMDRLHIISLGVDSVIGVWDGMLEEDWIENDVLSHSSDFCKSREATAVVLTWNAGATKPSDLNYDEHNATFFKRFLQQTEGPDLVIFGMQELVDLEDKKMTAKSFFKGRSKDSYGHEQLSSVYRSWRDYLTRCLDESLPTSAEGYTQLNSSSMVGLFTCVFVKTSQKARIREIQATEVKTGMGGLHGNKGALLVRFVLDDTSVSLVNCHLAAGQTQTANRNNDVASILNAAHLPMGRSMDVQSGVFAYGGDGTMVLDHEICILNGDLNYRIDTMGRETIIQAIKSNNLGKLQARDQLQLSRKKNPGFRLRDFTEAPIEFRPTYKYDVGSDTYDTSEKRRSPAWCDRILYRGRGSIEQLDYRRHEIDVSDHRPVSARFRLRIKTIQHQQREECRRRSKAKFEQLKRSAAHGAKLDYLRNVYGLSAEEAKSLLAQ